MIPADEHFFSYVSSPSHKLQGLIIIILSALITSLFSALPPVSTAGSIVIDSDMQYAYAEKLYNDKDFETASIEFERFIHFFPEDERVKEASLKRGISFMYLKRYMDAAVIFRNLSSPWSEERVNTESLFMLSAAFASMGRLGAAESTLRDLLLLTESEETRDRALYAVAWISLSNAAKNTTGVDESEKSLKKAITTIEEMSPGGRERFKADSLEDDIKDALMRFSERKKSPVAAGVVSVIPGGGFAYCNRYQDALISFMLNGAFILAASKSFEDGNAALGGLISFVGSGFYGGSIYGGISSAHKHNKRALIDAVQEMRLHRKETPFSSMLTPQVGDDSVSNGPDRYIASEKKSASTSEAVIPDQNGGLYHQEYSETEYGDPEKKSSGRKIPLLSVKIPF